MLYITLALALTYTPQPPAAANTLLNKIPDWTNALTVVDFKNILASPIAQREGWDKLPPADLLGGSVPYPRNTELAMLASHLEPGSLRSQRDLALVVGGPFSPIKELAKAENGYEETVAGISTVLSPKNAYLFNLEPKVFAIASPAHRQDTARWIRATQNNPTVTISNYLQQAYSSIGEGYHIVVSIDLQDAINPVLAKRFLLQSPLLKNKKVDVDALSKVLASSRGIRIGVRFDQTIKATLAADFNDNIKAFANILPALVLSSLDDMGGEMEEFPAASAAVQDKTFLITSTLSMKGLRRVLSLVPPVNGPVLVQHDPGIKAKPGDDTAPANQRYFKAIREAANDAHASADQKNDMIQAAQGYEKAAARIDQLAVANIDEELVKFSTFASSRLRAIADACRNAVLEATAVEAGRKVNIQIYPGFYTGYTLGPWNRQNPGDPYSPQGLWIRPEFTPPTYAVRTNDKELRTKQAEILAEGAKKRLEIWRQLTDESANVKKKMAIKFKVEF